MEARSAVVGSASGLHARPARLFVDAVQRSGVDVTIQVGDDAPVNAASILAVMGLGAFRGTRVTLRASGHGAAAALDELAALIESDLDAV